VNQQVNNIDDLSQTLDFDELVVSEITRNQTLLSQYIHRSVLKAQAVDDILQEVNIVI